MDNRNYWLLMTKVQGCCSGIHVPIKREMFFTFYLVAAGNFNAVQPQRTFVLQLVRLESSNLLFTRKLCRLNFKKVFSSELPY